MIMLNASFQNSAPHLYNNEWRDNGVDCSEVGCESVCTGGDSTVIMMKMIKNKKSQTMQYYLPYILFPEINKKIAISYLVARRV